MTQDKAPTPGKPDRIIDNSEARRRATARIMALVARCMVLGLRPSAIATRLAANEPESLGVLGFQGVPSVLQVRRWGQRASDEAALVVEDVKTARAMAVARLDCTLAPMIERIEAAAEEGEADLRAIEQLRRVVATQAEIQGVTRARESLADALESAMRSLVERSRREGTIRSETPNPPALRAGADPSRVVYRHTQPDPDTLQAEMADRRPGSIAAVLVNEGSDLGTVARVTAKARRRADDGIEGRDDLPT